MQWLDWKRLAIEWLDASGNSHMLEHAREGQDSSLSDIVLEEAGVTVRLDADSERVRVQVTSRDQVVMRSMELEGTGRVLSDAVATCNGYQSWTDSPALGLDSHSRSMGFLGRLLDKKMGFSSYGDYRFAPPARKRGEFQGWTWCSFHHGSTAKDQVASLIASLDDRASFTRFRLEVERPRSRSWYRRVRLGIARDLEGRVVRAGETLSALDCALFHGDSEAACFDAWCGAAGLHARKAEPCRGWTSWYKHYENIDAACLTQALADWSRGLSGKTRGFVFQIDDGWQAAVGDWLSVRQDRFPDGMGAMASAILEEGMVPGIWLAPLAAHKDSVIAREHPEWLVRDESGQPLLAGSNWGGFWGLDIQRPDVQDHLRRIFSIIVKEWGFRVLKLDFLYAACMVPLHGRTRGEIMSFAMDFLREIAGDAAILACGVPLASAFGVVEYCRIGCDVGLDWDGPWYHRFLHRERVSTRHSLASTYGRRHLNGRVFLNDPDVWIGRSTSDVRLTQRQKEILHHDNEAYGGLVFCSDLWSELDENWRITWKDRQ